MIENYYKSPIGFLKITTSQEKVISISHIKKVKKNNNKISFPAKETIRQLNEYFAGKRQKFELPIFIVATNFEEKVYHQLIKIRYGKYKTYKKIAEKCDSPKAARAVGNACKKNKLLIIVPCHRIIGSNQKLVGFSAGGVENKQWLLNFEKRNLGIF